MCECTVCMCAYELHCVISSGTCSTYVIVASISTTVLCFVLKLLNPGYNVHIYYSTDRLLSDSMYPSSLMHTVLLVEKTFVDLECVWMAIESNTYKSL